MKVVIDGTASEVLVEDAEDLNSLSVVLVNVGTQRAAELLADLGYIEGDHAWLRIETLMEMSPKPRSCSWDERFATTMAYAEKSGWTDVTATFVRAHLEPTNTKV